MTAPETPADTPRQTILDAAATIFVEVGFAGARVEAIARAAGVNKATLYYHVGDKAALYEAVVCRLFEGAIQTVEAAAASSQEPRARLMAIAQAMGLYFQANPGLPRIMAWELASGAATLPQAALMHWSRIFRIVAGALLALGIDPVPGYFTMAGGTMLYFLTEPLRQRVAGMVPGIPAALGVSSPEAMASFLLNTLLPPNEGKE
ncbi:TetR/AcrR family transcriptional regulator [Megalodesulfovibrio gigas]|uniref:Putative transcriptional regulator n=1 Tax=Megalodesulfovibrio gigas (strain ATCC 19364 / DSM 1382 / NCIMB 9332 / VKM B-1759) TaxID=1121448 RepID=T2GDP0_MEGG1|nr:TetR/AcrR family transcriptional regulator [Megalodesulfovibrio gigas]AGW14423.1 putative transcriptional regulator [Megalodesulfovibrio gigas DSM 1382 = ATCC 19364]